MNRRLYRSRTDSVIGGVAGGVAEYLDVDPSIVRIVWAVLAIVTGGIFFVLYIVMWIVVPENPGGVSYAPPPPGPGATPGWIPPGGEAGAGASAAAPAAEGTEPGEAAPAAQAAWTSPAGGYPVEPHRRRRGGSGGMVFGLILVALGAWFLLDEFVPGLDTDLLWPIGLVVLGGGLLLVSMRRQRE